MTDAPDPTVASLVETLADCTLALLAALRRSGPRRWDVVSIGGRVLHTAPTRREAGRWLSALRVAAAEKAELHGRALASGGAA